MSDPAASVVEEVLAADGVTHVVRVAGTVRRPVRPFINTIQAYLAHLHANGFPDAPRPLGRDGQGREMLSYVEGEVPLEPLPDWATTPQVLVALAKLVRRLHEAAAGWVHPADAVWGGIPGLPPAGCSRFSTPRSWSPPRTTAPATWSSVVAGPQH